MSSESLEDTYYRNINFSGLVDSGCRMVIHIFFFTLLTQELLMKKKASSSDRITQVQENDIENESFIVI